MALSQFITGTENGTIYRHGGLGVFVEEGIERGTFQRTSLAYFDEQIISIPISTPIGDYLFVEGYNFPSHDVWDEVKDHLIDFNFLVKEDKETEMSYTSTEVKTKEYTILWYAPFDSFQLPHNSFKYYNDFFVRGSTSSRHPKSLEKLLMPTSTPSFDNHKDFQVKLSGKKVKRRRYVLNEAQTVDFNGVPFTNADINDIKMVSNSYGEAIETSLYYKDKDIDSRPLKDQLGGRAVLEEFDRLAYVKRGNPYLTEHLSYVKTSTKIDLSTIATSEELKEEYMKREV